MFALDTNVLVRLLVDDQTDIEQCKVVRQRISAELSVWIPQVVLLETVWVLANRFGFGKADVLMTLKHLAENTRYHLQGMQAIQGAIADYADGSADFEDYLILAEARTAGYALLTLDKKLLNAKGTQRVK